MVKFRGLAISAMGLANLSGRVARGGSRGRSNFNRRFLRERVHQG